MDDRAPAEAKRRPGPMPPPEQLPAVDPRTGQAPASELRARQLAIYRDKALEMRGKGYSFEDLLDFTASVDFGFEWTPAQLRQLLGNREAPADHPAAQESDAPPRPAAADKTPTLKTAFAGAARPKLKAGDRPGVWRVLVQGRELGTVTRERHPGFAGSRTLERWKPHRTGSMLDALSTITYRTRAAAVQALVRECGLGG